MYYDVCDLAASVQYSSVHILTSLIYATNFNIVLHELTRLTRVLLHKSQYQNSAYSYVKFRSYRAVWACFRGLDMWERHRFRLYSILVAICQNNFCYFYPILHKRLAPK